CVFIGFRLLSTETRWLVVLLLLYCSINTSYEGQANLHVFEDWCGGSTAELRKNLHYPLYPHSRTTVKKLAVSPRWTNYGLRIFGYLHPYTDGEFVFALSSEDNSELWLSTDESPLNLQLLAWVGKTGTEWTAPGEFDKYVSQSSRSRRYFFEVIHKQNNKGTDHVEVAWRLQDEGFRFMIIESKHISLYVNETNLLMSDVSHIPQTAASHLHTAARQPSSAADMLREDPRDNLYKGEIHYLHGVLPDCSYKPSYTIKDFPLMRYQGLQFIHMSYIYPNDYTRLTNMESENSCFYARSTHYMEMFGFSRYMRLDLPERQEKGNIDNGSFFFEKEKLPDDREPLKAKEEPKPPAEHLSYKQNLIKSSPKMNQTQTHIINDSKLQPLRWNTTLTKTPRVVKQRTTATKEAKLQPGTNKQFSTPKRDFNRPVEAHKKTQKRRDTWMGEQYYLWGAGGDFDVAGEEPPTPAPVFDPEVVWSQTFQVDNLNLQSRRSDLIDLSCNVSGNLLLHSSDALSIVKAFMEQLNKKHQGRFTLDRVVNVVKRLDGVQGSRYLLELELKDVNGQLVRLSQYIYTLIRHSRQRRRDSSFEKAKPELVLCNPVGFRWNPFATVHFVVPVKNQARWVQQLIADMEKLFRETGDDNFNLIIADYNSTDMDVRKALQKSSLPRYQYVKLSGNFERSAGLQAGINLINDDHSIVFLCDLHIDFPSFMIDTIRKHCVEGYMAFAPIVMRLDCGSPPSEARGYWEVNGFGLLAIYKSDLDAVGGMNTKEFTDRWGGEDWELLDRLVLFAVFSFSLSFLNLLIPPFCDYKYHP
uniref:Beta-1,4-N-acetylgalactosaminyltransferase n=1 Tax=Echeneis naucrates TaxID=173247 RepID=A0A665VJ11_ECHNA